ncbi:hypothetical protein [Caballeronia sp. CLC5]|uniref:hypothetical protein n=1 Tax=Caballeronia sp. CLC5 TaxID=2906764 RepID=UPI0002FEDF84|nr:hypothetical protein [Caballeronia sp. CLC5]MCE4570030.1 hypothetical protein [Caballeronia sp. CLC5]
MALTYAVEYGRDSAAQPATDAPTAYAKERIGLLPMSEVIGAASHSIVQRMGCGFSILNWISHFVSRCWFIAVINQSWQSAAG